MYFETAHNAQLLIFEMHTLFYNLFTESNVHFVYSPNRQIYLYCGYQSEVNISFFRCRNMLQT
jgi:hypothetical protein